MPRLELAGMLVVTEYCVISKLPIGFLAIQKLEDI